MDEILEHVDDEDAEGVRSTEKREELKRAILEKVYAHMGNEIPPNELKNAIVVKTAKFHPVTVMCLSFVTLGLFNFFRPKDLQTYDHHILSL